MSKILDAIRDSLFVDKYNCIVCDEELDEPNEYGLCPTCLENMPYNEGKICAKCGKHMRDEASYCVTCQNNSFFFDINRSAFIYKGDAKKLIYALKFGGKKYLVKYMVAFYEKVYRSYEYDCDVITCVPISKGRYRERGYNQSHEIAKLLSKRLDIPYVEDVVIKIKEVVPQEKLGGKERLNNVIGAYKLNKKDDVKDKRVLLIDDVLTTGATMSAVAMELKRSAKSVECITFASPEVTYKKPSGNVEEDYSYEILQD